MNLEIIQNNPFRILGIYSNSSIKEITANKTKLNAYLKIGRSVEYHTDLNNLLPIIQRANQSVDNAISAINLPTNKIRYALFWFIKETPIDEVALNHLEAGNIKTAIELFNKKENYSSLLNKGVLSMINGQYNDGVSFITKMIHNDNYRENFIQNLIGRRIQITKKELAHIFIDNLLANDDQPEKWLQIFRESGKSDDDTNYIIDLLVRVPIKNIETQISTIDSKEGVLPIFYYNQGVGLMNNTKLSLEKIRDLLGIDSIRYQTISDNIAREILQCSIAYHNAGESGSRGKALSLAEYALSIAIGKVAKDRCKENVVTMEQNMVIEKIAREQEEDEGAGVWTWINGIISIILLIRFFVYLFS